MLQSSPTRLAVLMIMIVQSSRLTTSFLSKAPLSSNLSTSGSRVRKATSSIRWNIHTPNSNGISSLTYPPYSRHLSDEKHSTCSTSITTTTRRWMASSSTTETTSKPYLPTEQEKSMVRDMLYRIRECNDVPQEIQQNLKDFTIDGEIVGKVTEKVATLLCNSTPPSLLSSSNQKPVFVIHPTNGSLTLSDQAIGGTSIQERTDAVMSVMEHLRSQGIITGWRDELYPLSKGFYDEPVLLVERAAAPFLGMQQYGVHINGIVINKDNDKEEEKMWMARRSKTKSKYPGMLDHIVAGGQPAGLSLMENVIKECAEEAGVPEDITLAGIQPAGAVSYEQFEPSTGDQVDVYDGVVTRALLFNYDLSLPQDFIPKVVDGEVEEFFVWSIEEIIESMKKEYEDPIKPNCYLVIIDYLLRKGHLSPEIPGYLDIMRELRGGYCG